LDSGAIVARDENLLRRPLDPFSEPVVEWRALTVALLATSLTTGRIRRIQPAVILRGE